MKRFFGIIGLVLVTAAGQVRADEGMWLPNQVGKMRLKDMQAKGFRLKATDLYDPGRPSLKDAVVRFGGGCTGEIVSPEGLVLTNHHCGYDYVQSHSSVKNDLLTYGFWAMNREEELPNPGLTVTLLVRMEDVTKKSLKDVKPGMDEAQRQERIRANNARIAEKAVEGTHYKATVEPFYYGNRYFLFVTEVFEDVRLVGAPPSSIGKFGGDTDNWMWPRHTGDFSVFRIYAGKDNKPAPYSKDNVPYRPKRFLSVSTRGAGEGDFTFVYGFPGRTTEYVTSDAVDYLLNRGNPHKIALRTLRLNIMAEEQAGDAATRIKYASKHASVANAWKKWQGESKGIHRMKTIERKREQEKRFETWASRRPRYREVLPTLRKLYAELSDYAFARDYYVEAFGAVELARFAGNISKPVDGESDSARLQRIKGAGETFYKNYSDAIDRKTAVAIIREYVRNVPERFQPQLFREYESRYGSIEAGIKRMFDESALTTRARFDNLLQDAPGRMAAALANDPAVKFHEAFTGLYRNAIGKEYARLTAEIDVQYRTYMRGLMEMEQGRAFYPDANLTLRVAYGKVTGYEPADAVYYEPFSTLEGIMEKDNPEIYDYDVPEKLRELYRTKDYGRWGTDGTVPVGFIATNHTTGGNSGSPVLNGNGELLGLNFDRTWESTMSDVQYDPAVCRNIAVDIRYVLFVIEKVAGAGYLLDEMDIR